MLDLSRILGFEWDRGNSVKSYSKHGITPAESEELFLDPLLLVIEDVKHSHQEQRYIALGQNNTGTLLQAVFTLRHHKIRIISARKANQKERKIYEKTA